MAHCDFTHKLFALSHLKNFFEIQNYTFFGLPASCYGADHIITKEKNSAKYASILIIHGSKPKNTV